ncbi:MAG: very short patch repair endonuclease [Candidatus Saccharimonadaceae bacterium]
MTDVHSKAVRSFNMSRIKGKNTKPEMMVRKFLFSNGFRYRLHVNNLPGKPDIVLQKYKTVVFINGCFWHGHKDCKYYVIPKTRTEWWLEKINKTKSRDDLVYNKLTNMGWTVCRIWTCEITKEGSERLSKLIDEIRETK